MAQPRWNNPQGLDRADHLTWAELTPTEKRLTLKLSGRTHAQLTRAARRHGQSLQTWASATLSAAAQAELDSPSGGSSSAP